MLSIDILIANIRVTFWTNHQPDIGSLKDIFLYHIDNHDGITRPDSCHEVIITSSKKNLELPLGLHLVWEGIINTDTPIKWYNSSDNPENTITIGGDILIRHIPSKNQTICTLSESKARFLKLFRPKLTCYIFFLLHSILSMHGKYCLHASCVSKNGSACIFLGRSGEGKSTISTMLAKSGFEYMGDDLIFISKVNTGEIMVDAFLSKAKLLNRNLNTKEAIDIIKDNRFLYAYKNKLGAIVKLQRTHSGEKSILVPSSGAESFAWLMNSGNNIKIQYHPQEWMDICERAISVPLYTLMFAEKQFFEPAILDNIF